MGLSEEQAVDKYGADSIEVSIYLQLIDAIDDVKPWQSQQHKYL